SRDGFHPEYSRGDGQRRSRDPERLVLLSALPRSDYTAVQGSEKLGYLLDSRIFDGPNDGTGSGLDYQLSVSANHMCAKREERGGPQKVMRVNYA
ncbi:hypothetical protein X777_16769, partial [Ooceraea biroi]